VFWFASEVVKVCNGYNLLGISTLGKKGRKHQVFIFFALFPNKETLHSPFNHLRPAWGKECKGLGQPGNEVSAISLPRSHDNSRRPQTTPSQKYTCPHPISPGKPSFGAGSVPGPQLACHCGRGSGGEQRNYADAANGAPSFGSCTVACTVCLSSTGCVATRHQG